MFLVYMWFCNVSFLDMVTVISIIFNFILLPQGAVLAVAAAGDAAEARLREDGMILVN